MTDTSNTNNNTSNNKMDFKPMKFINWRLKELKKTEEPNFINQVIEDITSSIHNILTLKIYDYNHFWIIPILIYFIIYVLSFIQKDIYNNCRIIWLFITYIILYSENGKYILRVLWFIITVSIEIILYFKT